MGLLRRLLPAMALAALAAGPAVAAEHGAHLATLAARYGDELYDRRDQVTYYDETSHLLRDWNGRLNVAETSLNYAAALLAAGEQTERALQVIEASLAWQDSAEGSVTRGLFRWMVRATSSLPVPLSPSMRTEQSLRATLSARRTTSRNARDVPMISGRSRFSREA